MGEARRAIAEGTELCRRWDRESLGWSNTFSVALAAWGGERPSPDTLVHGRRAVEIAEEIGDAFSRIVGYSWLPPAPPPLPQTVLPTISSTTTRRQCGSPTTAWR